MVVDLDGTLIESDMLLISLRQIVRRAPLKLLRLPLWLVRGRVYCKGQLAQAVSVNPADLPFSADVLRFIEHAHSQRRELVLATGSHVLHAQLVADYLGFFDLVLASAGQVNLKSRHKAETLVSRYGLSGFDYIGNSMADIPVWQSAHGRYLVNPDWGLRRRLRKIGLVVQSLYDHSPC